MIAYFVAVPTMLFSALSHRLGINKQEEAVLFIQKSMYDTRGLGYLAEELKKQRIYSDVVACSLIWHWELSLNGIDDDVMEKKLLEYYDELLHRYGYDADNFEKIYVIHDIWEGDINIYFNLRKIRYTWIETAKNKLFTGTDFPAMNKRFVPFCVKYQFLTPFAEYADACILSDSDISRKKLEKKGYTTWNCRKCFDSITPEDMQRLFRCFHLAETGLTQADWKGSVLIIKNSYGYLSGCIPSERDRLAVGYGNLELAEIYAVMDKVSLDFYAPDAGQIYLKCHIHDMMDSETVARLYGDGVKVFPNVPFEILGKYFESQNIRFQTIIGAMSSSLNAVNKANCEQSYCLGIDFAKTWWFYISLYAALLFAKSREIRVIYTSSVLKTQLELIADTMEYDVVIEERGSIRTKDIRNALMIADMRTESEKEILKEVHASCMVIFLNADLSNRFFESGVPECFTPMRVRKTALREQACESLLREETLWIYAEDIQSRKAARSFAFEQEFQNLGLKAFVDKVYLPEAVEMFYCGKMMHENQKQGRWLAHMTERFDNLVCSMDYKIDNAMPVSDLKNITDIYSYLDLLRVVRKKYLVILSVCDTPGNYIAANVINRIHEMGFRGFSKELWRMYIGVGNHGKIVFDTAGEKREAPVHYTCENPLLGINISVSSMAWRQGNKASIIINGIDYAVNMRGINIVVYDTENETLIDSVAFDWHTVDLMCRRTGQNL